MIALCDIVLTILIYKPVGYGILIGIFLTPKHLRLVYHYRTVAHFFNHVIQCVIGQNRPIVQAIPQTDYSYIILLFQCFVISGYFGIAHRYNSFILYLQYGDDSGFPHVLFSRIRSTVFRCDPWVYFRSR